MSGTKRLQHFKQVEGKAYQLGPLKMAFKRSDAEDEGAYSLFESLEPPGASVPLHRHAAWQETFIVLKPIRGSTFARCSGSTGSRCFEVLELLRMSPACQRARGLAVPFAI